MKIIDTPESRVFECRTDAGQVLTLRVRRANRRELEAADLEQSRVFNQALLAGLPPRMRLLRKLREQGLWTSDDETNLATLREKSARLEVRLAELDEQIKPLTADGSADAEAAAKLDAALADKNQVVKDRAATLKQLTQLRQEIDGMLGHTSDAKAEDAHRNFLLACVAEKVKLAPDNSASVVSRVWDSLDALMAETDTNLLQRTIYEYMMFSAGLPSEWEDDAASPPADSSQTSNAAAPAREDAAAEGATQPEAATP